MAMRSALSLSRLTTATRYRSMESTRGAIRYMSDGKGRVLSEEERAKETVFIQYGSPCEYYEERIKAEIERRNRVGINKNREKRGRESLRNERADNSFLVIY
ncbi:hypothetical protein COLO4_37375 [Corchorus olitorius]|uniref:Uncharacterized protein n=1 Tax=Corchorus olitorius TaxID=93759 RepID=A0A1R3G281_9ROSI|nr:hypothetical protein COLO4_37375 [Corchorus olitorius]